MANFFRATALLIMISVVSAAFAAQTPPPQSLSLQQFQQWMQQQNGPSSSAPRPVAQSLPPSGTFVQTTQAIPQPGGSLPPPGSQQVIETGPVIAPPSAIPVNQSIVTQTSISANAAVRPNRQETILFNNHVERYGPRPRAHVSRKTYRSSTRPMSYEQSRRIMLHSVPSSLVPPIEDSDYAFNSVLQRNTPLTPQQVVKLHQQIDISQRAAATPPLVPPKPVSTTLMINLAPGTTPPAVRLAQGYVSSLVFVDSTGAPWPIAAFDIGNPKSVNIQWDATSNILLMQAVTPYSYGDIVIRLVGLPTPITLEIVSGQRVVDYRVDIHVPGIGPNTKELPIGSTLPGPANNLLLSVLDGVDPPGSRPLNVRGADCQAWLLGDRIFLRCRFTVLSPGWMGKMVSPDGMNAYELPKTSSVLISRYGEPAELKIEGF